MNSSISSSHIISDPGKLSWNQMNFKNNLVQQIPDGDPLDFLQADGYCERLHVPSAPPLYSDIKEDKNIRFFSGSQEGVTRIWIRWSLKLAKDSNYSDSRNFTSGQIEKIQRIPGGCSPDVGPLDFLQTDGACERRHRTPENRPYENIQKLELPEYKSCKKIKSCVCSIKLSCSIS